MWRCIKGLWGVQKALENETRRSLSTSQGIFASSRFSNMNNFNMTLNQHLTSFLKRCHSSEPGKTSKVRSSKCSSGLAQHRYWDVNKLSIVKHKDLKAGFVLVKNIPPLQTYFENLSNYDSDCTWIKVYMVIKTDLKLYIFLNETREPFIDTASFILNLHVLHFITMGKFNHKCQYINNILKFEFLI